METNDQHKRGRPSDYSAEIAEMICDRLVNGESLRAHLCRSRDAGQSHSIPLSSARCQAEDLAPPP
jgi:hypothetical protein